MVDAHEGGGMRALFRAFQRLRDTRGRVGAGGVVFRQQGTEGLINRDQQPIGEAERTSRKGAGIVHGGTLYMCVPDGLLWRAVVGGRQSGAAASLEAGAFAKPVFVH